MARRILVTGEKPRQYPKLQDIEWQHVSTLKFERVTPVALEAALHPPPHWVIFTSPRSILFLNETLLEASLEFPAQTQVACIGEATHEIALQEGYPSDFYPLEPGSENFVREFGELLANLSWRPKVLLPCSDQSRPYLQEELEKLGCKVQKLVLYQTLAVTPPQPDYAGATLLVTSPSCARALHSSHPWPNETKLVAIGEFTAGALREMGYHPELLPGGSFERIDELFSPS